MKTKCDLEQELLDCWKVTQDIDDLFAHILDSEEYEGMDPVHADKIANVLLGIKSLYDIKFDRTFKTFEKVVHPHEATDAVKALDDYKGLDY